MSGHPGGARGGGGCRNDTKCYNGEGDLKSAEKVSHMIWMAPYVCQQYYVYVINLYSNNVWRH